MAAEAGENILLSVVGKRNQPAGRNVFHIPDFRLKSVPRPLLLQRKAHGEAVFTVAQHAESRIGAGSAGTEIALFQKGDFCACLCQLPGRGRADNSAADDGNVVL
ncbi:hypothetical protein SDC9_77507 [bioreactor metagenome]|uniref:Uncharacterized protein n=1 Tax=bioreactor metagenome TaxID=1076179 RepID=A0A644YYA5_9ZZZZ